MHTTCFKSTRETEYTGHKISYGSATSKWIITYAGALKENNLSFNKVSVNKNDRALYLYQILLNQDADC